MSTDSGAELGRPTVDDAIHRLRPDYVAAVVVADGLHDEPPDSSSARELRAAADKVRRLGLDHASELPHLAAWRTAFADVGIKAKRFPCSAEALVARALKDKDLPSISALVDAYNAVSLSYAVPIGGEDLDAVVGQPCIAIAGGGEPFELAGGEESAQVAPGEVMRRDEAGVTCRRWNWRQGRRTQLTRHTRRAYFVLDRLAPMTVEELEAAVDDLCWALRRRCPGARFDVSYLGSAGRN